MEPPLSKVPLPTLRTWKKSQENCDNSTNNTIRTVKAIPKASVGSGECIHSMQPPEEPLYYCMPTIEIPYVLQYPSRTENIVALQPEISTNANVDLQESVNNENELPIPNFTDEEVARLLRDMETQTDDVDLDTLDMNNEVLVPLLRDIQTQTLDNRQHQSTMTELDLEAEVEAEQNANTTNDFVSYQ